MAIQVLRGNESDIKAENPVLEAGRPCYELDTHKLKIGDGTTAYNDLPYIGDYPLDLMYPVGSIYISINDTNPSTLFGGTWERFAQGKTLVGVNESEDEFDTVQKTGGEKTHKLTTTEMPAHNHTQAAHNHSGSAQSGGSHSHTASSNSTGAHNHGGTIVSGGSHTHTIYGYNWRTKRDGSYSLTADSDGNTLTSVQLVTSSSGGHSHTLTINNNSNHSHTITVNSGGSHTHTLSINNSTPTINNTGGSGSHNNLQPYITTYMWKRTA